MTEKEIFRIWNSSENQEHLDMKEIRFVADVETDLKRFNLFIDNRDLGFIVPGVLAIIFMLFGAYGSTLIQAKVVQFLLAIWVFFGIIKILLLRRSRPAPISDSYFQYLTKTKKYLHNQKRLYDLVVYWSVLPFVILMSLYFWAPVIWKEPTISKLIVAIVFTVICLLAGVRIYRKNRIEFNNEVRPRIEKVDQLIGVIENHVS